MRTLNRWFLSIFLGLIVCSSGSFAADGKYQKTKDGKTTVWNSEPQPGDSATWSGDRDDSGYASGYGTLTWYVASKPSFLTGSNIPSSKPIIYGEYTGRMVHGKLEGTVDVKAKGKLAHATFKDGSRSSLWLSGLAPKESVARKSATPAPEKAAEPEAPAAGPSPAVEAKPTPNISVAPPPPNKSAREMDDSLKSLVGPPSLLHDRTTAPARATSPVSPQSAPPSPPQTAPAPAAASTPAVEKPGPSGPVLSKNEAIEIAASEARTEGYDPSQYPTPRAYYVSADDSWSVFYDQKSSADGMASGKRFIVTVEDKSRKASVTSSK